MDEDEIFRSVKVAITDTLDDVIDEDLAFSGIYRDYSLGKLSRAAIAAYKAALAEAGYVIVPREPTEKLSAAERLGTNPDRIHTDNGGSLPRRRRT